VDWQVEIKNSAGVVVREFGLSSETLSQIWDGKNNSGSVVSEGQYDVIINAYDSAQNSTAVSVRAVVNIVLAQPTAVFLSPILNSTISSGQLSIIGSAYHNTGDTSYTLDYRLTNSAGVWTPIQTGGPVISDLLGVLPILDARNWLLIPNGEYSIRLVVTDVSGNQSEAITQVVLNTLAISDVVLDKNSINAVAGETVFVNFVLSREANVTLNWYTEKNRTLVRKIGPILFQGGNNTIIWDGRNDLNKIVADEAYVYDVHITDGSNSVIARDLSVTSEAAQLTTIPQFGTVDAYFNAHQNDYWKMTDYFLRYDARVRFRITPQGKLPFYLLENVYYPAGIHALMWDGRDLSGNIIEGSASFFFEVLVPVSRSLLQITGGTTSITGYGAAPNIEVKSDPYLVTHSFDQISKIGFHIDQEATVTIKLVPPGILDIESPLAIEILPPTLLQAESLGIPIDHLAEWTGYLQDDTNNILTTDEATYTFIIQATSAVSGASAIYRGSLQLYQ